MTEWDGAAAARMMLEEPENAYTLLRGYMLLIGEGGAWWKASAYADSPFWASAVRAAIVEIARPTGVPARDLARLLDENDLPRTRAKVLTLATERFRKGIR